MDWQIIIGIAGLALVILAFLWGTGILARREKVRVANSNVYVEFVPKGREVILYDGVHITLPKHSILISVHCELVLIKGDKETEIKEVEVRFDRVTSEKLREYFRMPIQNRLRLEYLEPHTRDRLSGAMLQPKKAVLFEEQRLFPCTDKFKRAYKNIRSSSYQEFSERLDRLVEQLSCKYQICWTRYDGTELCWRFPQKWWRNLSKRLWG